VNTDCIETTYARDRFGYGMATSKELYSRSVQHHRVAYVEANNLTLADIKGAVVRHKCDNPSCVNPDHLELGTAKDNMADMISRGRRVDHLGTTNGKSKLTELDVAAIRSEKLLTQYELAAKYNVSREAISAIITRRTWKHI